MKFYFDVYIERMGLSLTVFALSGILTILYPIQWIFCVTGIVIGWLVYKSMPKGLTMG